MGEGVVVGVVCNEVGYSNGTIIWIFAILQDRPVFEYVGLGDGLIEGEEHQLWYLFRFEIVWWWRAEASAVGAGTIISAIFKKIKFKSSKKVKVHQESQQRLIGRVYHWNEIVNWYRYHSLELIIGGSCRNSTKLTSTELS